MRECFVGRQKEEGKKRTNQGKKNGVIRIRNQFKERKGNSERRKKEKANSSKFNKERKNCLDKDNVKGSKNEKKTIITAIGQEKKRKNLQKKEQPLCHKERISK